MDKKALFSFFLFFIIVYDGLYLQLYWQKRRGIKFVKESLTGHGSGSRQTKEPPFKWPSSCPEAHSPESACAVPFLKCGSRLSFVRQSSKSRYKRNETTH